MALYIRRKVQRITLLACVDNGRGIGKDNKLLYKLNIDMAMFRLLTINNVVLMGAKTFESLGCKALPNRLNVIITRSKAKYAQYEKPNEVLLYDDLKQALLTLSSEHVYVIGGASIYEQLLPYADELVITHVNDVTLADTFFPNVNMNDWHRNLILRTADQGHDIAICKYVRKQPITDEITVQLHNVKF